MQTTIRTLKRWLCWITPHFKVGLFLYTPPTRYRKESLEFLPPGSEIVLTRTQKLVEAEYFTWFGFRGITEYRSVRRRS